MHAWHDIGKICVWIVFILTISISAWTHVKWSIGRRDFSFPSVKIDHFSCNEEMKKTQNERTTRIVNFLCRYIIFCPKNVKNSRNIDPFREILYKSKFMLKCMKHVDDGVSCTETTRTKIWSEVHNDWLFSKVKC